MQKHITDRKTGIGYTLNGDYYLPNIRLPEKENCSFGKYGNLHRKYLLKYKKVRYNILLISGKLHSYLAEVDEQASCQVELIIKQMAQRQGITEELKAKDFMSWVGAMNNIRNCAEETVLSELIYN